MKIGCDIEHISRIQHVNKNDRLARRILSSSELKRYEHFSPSRKQEFLCGRWCAKEAIIKALDASLSMKQIDLGESLNIILQNKQVQVSISHSHDIAMAMVIVYETN